MRHAPSLSIRADHVAPRNPDSQINTIGGAGEGYKIVLWKGRCCSLGVDVSALQVFKALYCTTAREREGNLSNF